MRIVVRRLRLVLFIAMAAVAGALVPAAALAQGCAMCGTAFTHDDPVTRAFSWSVLFLIAMPYTVFGIAAGWLFLAHRRRSDRHRAEVITLPRSRPVPAPAAGPKES
jgi:ABC-type sulfate transport system permease subunit